uniref:M1-comp1 n=1 Tax=Linum usitatissimum TaxID=4006 RepID=C6JW24_LINUS|nr:M1-comp1 [Linum usitatissimum]
MKPKKQQAKKRHQQACRNKRKSAGKRKGAQNQEPHQEKKRIATESGRRNFNNDNEDTIQQTDSASVVGATSSSTNPSGSLPSVEYEVFLSFRGPDTRYQITDILSRFLHHAKIHTFIDNDELRKGEEIKSSLLSAIDQSKIYVPIISEGYADSKWCLMELAEIIRQKEQDPQRIILPIFYMVDPKNVRHQTGRYEKAFQEHGAKFEEKIIQSWKDALAKVGQIKGWHVQSNDEQGDIADKVYADIWSHLSKENSILDTDELVGIDDHIKVILEKLSLNSESVTMVGLYGMGGIGKTTTAKAVYNKISSRFDHCCFLENIRETQNQKDGVVVLQQKLVSEILRMDSVGFTNDSGGRKMIKERVSKSKILIVLDDVDEKFKFEEILGCPNDFDSRSRFIITSRNQKVLSTLNENQCQLYEVGSMSEPHSLELFFKHAFKKNTPSSKYVTQANEIVSTTGGLPLTLKVIGSLLYRQQIEVWEDTLEQLHKTGMVGDDEVYERLKRSYDKLELKAKEIFLDIACFFINTKKEEPYHMWSDCNFYPKSNIIFLIQRCMIQVGDDGVFKMHDQLKDMGREIVRREDVERPWKRSRIWSSEEGIDLLLNKKGSSQVKAIRIDPPWESDVKYFIFCKINMNIFFFLQLYMFFLQLQGSNQVKAISILSPLEWNVKYEFKSECFLNLSELRYFDADPTILLTGDFNNLLPNLRWLQLPANAYEEDGPLLTNFTMKNLIILILGINSGMELLKVHDFPPSVEELIYDSLYSSRFGWGLMKVNLVVAERLKVVRLSPATFIRIPETLGCWRFPKSIEVLSMSGIQMEELDIGELKKLKTLDLSYCKIQKISGGTFGMLKGLIVLDLNFFNCTNLREVVADIGQLLSLEVLRTLAVEEVEINEFPLDLKELSTSSRILNLSEFLDLEVLRVYDCKDGMDIPPAKSTEDEGSVWWKVSKLKSLALINTEINVNVVDDASSSGHLPRYLLPTSLTSLQIARCEEPTWLPGIENLENLTRLEVKDISQTLGGDLDGLQGLRSLKTLTISAVNGLVRIKGLKDLLCSSTCNLQSLVIEYCPDLTELFPCELDDQTVVVVPSLVELTIRDCRWLEVGPVIRSLPKFPMLNHLTLSMVNITKEEELEVLGSLEELASLELKLDDKSSSSIERISFLSKLKTLDLSGSEIQKISGGTFGMLKGLIELHLDFIECTNLREVVADICQLSSLKILKIHNVKEVEINEFPLGLKELSTSSRIPNLLDLLDLEELEVYDCKDGIDIPPAKSTEDEGSVWWKVSKLKSLALINTEINVNVVDDASSSGHLPRYLLPTSLTALLIARCEEPTWLPEIENLENLTWLAVNDISQTLGSDLDGLQGLRSLETLYIMEVNGLVRIKGLKDLLCSSTCKLQKLCIKACLDLTEILPCELHDQTVVVPSLVELTIGDCPRLEVGPIIRSLPKFPMLEELKLDDTWSSIERIASLSKLQKLHTLTVKVPSLREIEGLAELKSLEYLVLQGCTSLERLWPDEQQLDNNKSMRIDIRGCKSLSVDHLSALKSTLPPNVKIRWPDEEI